MRITRLIWINKHGAELCVMRPTKVAEEDNMLFLSGEAEVQRTGVISNVQVWSGPMLVATFPVTDRRPPWYKRLWRRMRAKYPSELWLSQTTVEAGDELSLTSFSIGYPS